MQPSCNGRSCQRRHAKPLLKNNLVFGLIAGLMLGLSLAFLLELMHRKVRCLEDLEREFDVPVMAQVGFHERLLDKDVNIGRIAERKTHA
jgi:capsular polysaccharide biosynthesis protein